MQYIVPKLPANVPQYPYEISKTIPLIACKINLKSSSIFSVWEARSKRTKITSRSKQTSGGWLRSRAAEVSTQTCRHRKILHYLLSHQSNFFLSSLSLITSPMMVEEEIAVVTSDQRVKKKYPFLLSQVRAILLL